VTDPAVLDTKIGPEGRVVIPVAIRRLLGVSAGDHVQFVVLDGHVELVSARQLAHQMWANNHGGDALDSTDVVRAERAHDRLVEVAAEQRVAAESDVPENWDERATTARLMSALGLAE
jgi:AbrB family looped-hinge helix DNA binding protein